MSPLFLPAVCVRFWVNALAIPCGACAACSCVSDCILLSCVPLPLLCVHVCAPMCVSGPVEFTYCGKEYKRTDVVLENGHKLKLQCSHWEPTDA